VNVGYPGSTTAETKWSNAPITIDQAWADGWSSRVRVARDEIARRLEWSTAEERQEELRTLAALLDVLDAVPRSPLTWASGPAQAIAERGLRIVEEGLCLPK
jgi:hypothetical protein